MDAQLRTIAERCRAGAYSGRMTFPEIVATLMAAGFDGVYLDRADVYGSWKRERATAKADMAEFVAALSAYARQRKPGFLIVLQNAEELLADGRVRSALDGVAKEDLLFGVEGEGKPNTPSDVEASLKFLRMAKRDGLPVFVVEYIGEPTAMAGARQRLATEGFVPYFGPRLLNALADPG